MSLTTPSKLRELQIQLYRKAKNEFPVQSRGTHHFSDEVVFGDSGPVASRCPMQLSSLLMSGDGKRGRRLDVSARAHPRLYIIFGRS